MLYQRPTFTVPAAPTQNVPCAGDVHHYVRGKCLRCEKPEPNWRPADSQAFQTPTDDE